MAAIVMTLSVLECHFPIASLFKCDISYLWLVARYLCTLLLQSFLYFNQTAGSDKQSEVLTELSTLVPYYDGLAGVDGARPRSCVSSVYQWLVDPDAGD